MVPFLAMLSGLVWTIAYIESIHIGFRDKTYAMQVATMGVNVCSARPTG